MDHALAVPDAEAERLLSVQLRDPHQIARQRVKGADSSRWFSADNEAIRRQ
jgi:hypothetical protein